MSKLEKNLAEELVIRKAKYRVKNSDGKYEVVYLETSADQVEETSERVFVTPQEKTQITSNKEAIAAETQARTQAVNTINGKLDVINGNEETAGSINKALKDAKAYTDEKVQEINGVNSGLTGRVETVEQGLQAVDGKINTAKTEAIEAAKSHTTQEISKIDAAYKAADTATLESAKADTLEKVNAAKGELQSKIDGLTGKVDTNEREIASLKEAVTNKNNNTVVVNTEAEIATANAEPKVGDLAFVISSKRAYIYKGVEAVTAKNAPEGWVVFDEITSELDLVDYLKKTDAEATYRKKADKIAEGDLATELAQKINEKLNSGQVDAKIEAVVNPVSQKADANDVAIKKEVSDRKGEITRVEGLVTAETSARNEAIENAKSELNGTIQGVSSKADNIDTAYKAADKELTQRINKFVPVIASEQPEGTETGHVWLEIQALPL